MKNCSEVGTFTIRTHECHGSFHLSMRDTDRVKHYRIKSTDTGQYFITRRVLFDSLQQLVEYYSAQVGLGLIILHSNLFVTVKTNTPGLLMLL